MTGFQPSFAAIVLMAFAAACFVPSQVRAEVEYPWCSLTATGQSGMPSCRFATIEQCQAFIAGLSGFCQPNARVVARQPVPPRGR